MNKKNIFDLHGKYILLTGASGLLGQAYAEGLSRQGANVILADIDYNKCKLLEISIKKKYSVNPFAIKVDLTKKTSISKMLIKIKKKTPIIDILINNAMYHEGKKEQNITFEQFPLSSWNKVISVNLTGMFLLCQEIGKLMKKQKQGVIINVSSIYGLVGADQRIYENSGINSSVAYATTKSAVLNFTRYLASYWHKDGIRVNSISLGGVENNQNPNFIKNYSHKTMMRRMAKKEEYVGAMIFLCSDASSYMTGSNLIVDGGWTAW